MYAEASVLVARAEGNQALALLREARRGFAELQAAYEVASCRALTGRAYQQLGDMESATAELTEAGLEFARLGARPAGRPGRSAAAGERTGGPHRARGRGVAPRRGRPQQRPDRHAPWC